MKKIRLKIKEYQANNPKSFAWIVGGIPGWIITIILTIVYVATH